MRFSFVKRLVDVLPHDTLAEVAERIQSFGWHLVIYVESPDLPDLCDFFSSLPGTIVFDHMGRPDVSKEPDGEEFDLFVRLLAENENIWAKVSCPDRLTVSGPPDYEDVVPFARRVVEADNYMRGGRFNGWELFQPHLGIDVFGKTLGVVGMGRTGMAVARRGR